MLKNKHDALAAELLRMLTDLDQFIEKGRRLLELVQFHFYAKVLPLNVPPPPSNILKILCKSHAIGMSILSPSEALREACCLYPVIGALLPLPVYLKSQCPNITPNAPFATWWSVKTTLAKEMNPLIENGRWDTLLFCPDTSELSNEIDWFEKDDYTNSFSYTMQTAFEAIGKENTGKAIIRRNLAQLALPYFRTVVGKWPQDQKGNDTIPKNLSTVFTKPFAPTDTDDLDAAYAKVRRALRERKFRNYEHLMISWRKRLEALMFTDVNWASSEKEQFIKEWELNLFGCPIKDSKKHDGRWEQGRMIDRPTAGKLLQYFIDRFLENPLKNKKDGEIACVLWTSIWLSQDPEATDITLTRILSLDTAAVDKEDPELHLDGKPVEISLGLHRLLSILRGNSTNKRRRRLFGHISADYLQQAFKEASVILFGANTLPVSPAAFLSLPHAMKGCRFSRNQVEIFRSAKVGPEAGYHRRQFLKAFREAIPKPPSILS